MATVLQIYSFLSPFLFSFLLQAIETSTIKAALSSAVVSIDDQAAAIGAKDAALEEQTAKLKEQKVALDDVTAALKASNL